jgi:hypothetical protein
VCLYFSVADSTDDASDVFVNVYGNIGEKRSLAFTVHVARHAEAASAETIMPKLDEFYVLAYRK